MKIDDPASYYRDPEQYRRLIEESLAECEELIRQLQREHGPPEDASNG